MIRIDRILCPVDFSETSRHALDHAAALARWYDASLSALYVHPLPMPAYAVGPGVSPTAFQPIVLTADERAQLTQTLDQFVASATRAGIRVEGVLREDLNVAAAIVDAAASLQSDLVVIGTHGRSGFERLMLGSVAEKVLRRAGCPVMTVPPRSADAVPRGFGAMERILCAVDFSPSSARAVRYAAALRQRASARLLLVHVVELPHQLSELGVPGLGEYRSTRFEEARRAFAASLPAELSADSQVEQLVLAGNPHREILRCAREKEADLIVMGAQGHSDVERLLFGSTSQQVVRQASCPVLTLRDKP